MGSRQGAQQVQPLAPLQLLANGPGNQRKRLRWKRSRRSTNSAGMVMVIRSADEPFEAMAAGPRQIHRIQPLQSAIGLALATIPRPRLFLMRKLLVQGSNPEGRHPIACLNIP